MPKKRTLGEQDTGPERKEQVMETTQAGSLMAADGKDGICEATPRHQGRIQNSGGKGRSHSEQDLVLQQARKQSTTEYEHVKERRTTVGLGVRNRYVGPRKKPSSNGF